MIQARQAGGAWATTRFGRWNWRHGKNALLVRQPLG
jgi:hypothetical protein